MNILKVSYLVLLALSFAFISCTNPNLEKQVDESKNSEAFTVHESKTAETNSTDSVIYLDRLNETPSITLEETEVFEDTSVAVDDYIWRQLNLAQEYYMMGILANSETIWDEAQYYFEKSLGILGDLDIEPESDTFSAEEVKYNQILAEIIANYKITLISLGHLPSDVSADVLIARFSELNHIKTDSTQLKRLGELAAEKAAYNIPVIMNERVKNCILYYQTVARDAIVKYLSRSTKYIPMIDSIFAEYELPSDLKYLVLVESGFNPKAYSWARAMGLWQFISSTGRQYNLKRNWWYDERRDPIKSTHSAARFLGDLYKRFDCWELAMAAYNGGPGRVSKTIKRQKTTDFWKMKLKKQTMDYVPFFMAATIISKNPEKFGFSDIEYEPKWVYDEVTINKCLDLNVVARELGTTVGELKKHNPELLRQFTPPNMKKYTLRIPRGMKSKFLAAYDSMPSSKQTSWVKHKIRKGQTVSTIARKYGVSQYAIFSANNLSRRSKIYAGKTLIVPVPNSTNFTSKKSRKYEASGDIYIVQSGDNVWDIAKAFGTTTGTIRTLNKLDKKGRIYVGQKLRIYKSGNQRVETDQKSNVNDNGLYKVRRGDSLWEIAQKYGTSVSILRKLNGLGRRSYIYPGQKLKIPDMPTQSDNYRVYVVRKGDTISEIAIRHNTSVSNLIAWNSIHNPRRINIGDQLKIYTN